MRYLGLALFAEGPADHRFLSPILRRMAEDLCLRYSGDQVEIGNIIALHSLPQHRDEGRETRIVEAARQARGAYNILFIHTDSDGDRERAWQERIRPAMSRLIERDIKLIPPSRTQLKPSPPKSR